MGLDLICSGQYCWHISTTSSATEQENIWKPRSQVYYNVAIVRFETTIIVIINSTASPTERKKKNQNKKEKRKTKKEKKRKTKRRKKNFAYYRWTTNDRIKRVFYPLPTPSWNEVTYTLNDERYTLDDAVVNQTAAMSRFSTMTHMKDDPQWPFVEHLLAAGWRHVIPEPVAKNSWWRSTAH